MLVQLKRIAVASEYLIFALRSPIATSSSRETSDLNKFHKQTPVSSRKLKLLFLDNDSIVPPTLNSRSTEN